MNPNRCDPNRPDEAAQAAKQKREQLAALGLLTALVSVIKESGTEGAPEGPLYMACMSKGYSLENFQKAMSLLAEKGLIRRSNNVAYFIEELP